MRTTWIGLLLLLAQPSEAFDSSRYGNTLPTLTELKCFADKKPQLVSVSPQWEDQNAFVLGILAGLAYYQLADALPVAHALGFSKVEQIEGVENKIDEANVHNWIISHTTGLWLENETDVVIAVGGTNPKNVKNFITDAQFLPLAFDKFGEVHGGFLNALNIIQPQLTLKIRALRATGKIKNIHLTGHSLGGAIVTLAALRLLGPELNVETLRNLYTFGSPHTGLADFEKAFRETTREPGRKLIPNTFRVVHQWDVVTRLLETEKRLREKSGLPLDRWGWESVLPDYQHVGDFVFVTGEGKVLQKEAARAAFSFFGDPTAGIRHHDIRFYTEYAYRAWRQADDSGCL